MGGDSLNDVGTLIWNLIDGRTGVDGIVKEVCRHYDVALDEAGPDVRDFLNALEAAGLVRKSTLLAEADAAG